VAASSTSTSDGVLFVDPFGIFVDTATPSPTVYIADQGTSAVYILETSGTAPNFAIAGITTIQGAATGLNGPMGIVVVH
jgi:hypothetical protein